MYELERLQCYSIKIRVFFLNICFIYNDQTLSIKKILIIKKEKKERKIREVAKVGMKRGELLNEDKA